MATDVGASGACVGVAGGASGVSEGVNMPIMSKIANAYTTYPNILIVRLSLRIKGNLSFIPICFHLVFMFDGGLGLKTIPHVYHYGSISPSYLNLIDLYASPRVRLIYNLQNH